MMHPKYYNKLGEECKDENDPEKFGKLVNLTLKYPHLIFVFDECGHNTNMSSDKVSTKNKNGLQQRVPE